MSTFAIGAIINRAVRQLPGGQAYLNVGVWNGFTLLAGMADKEVNRLIKLKGLPKLTEATLTSKTALAAELQKVRLQGWALDNQENEIEGRCIGAPVFGPGDQVVAAVSISGPEFRMDMARAKGLVEELKAACAEISKAVRG